MIYGRKGLAVSQGVYFDVRADLGDARDFDLAGEIFVPHGSGKWGRDAKLGLDTLDVPPETMSHLARQSTSCN